MCRGDMLALVKGAGLSVSTGGEALIPYSKGARVSPCAGDAGSSISSGNECSSAAPKSVSLLISREDTGFWASTAGRGSFGFYPVEDFLSYLTVCHPSRRRYNQGWMC